MNVHPVKIGLLLKDNLVLLENMDKVCQILELMSDREFRNVKNVNEVLSLKFHIIRYILKDIKKELVSRFNHALIKAYLVTLVFFAFSR